MRYTNTLIAAIALGFTSLNVASAAPISALEKASCEFDGMYAGQLVESTLVHAKWEGYDTYVYNLEGCGGGNHYEAYIALVKDEKVVTAQPVQEQEGSAAFGDVRQRKFGHIVKMEQIRSGCLEGMLQLYTKKNKLTGYYLDGRRLTPYLGGC